MCRQRCVDGRCVDAHLELSQLEDARQGGVVQVNIDHGQGLEAYE